MTTTAIHPDVIAGEAPTLPPFAPASPDDLDKQHEFGQFQTPASDTSPLIPLPIRCGEGDLASLFEIHRSEVRLPQANLGRRNADSFRAGMHPNLKAGFVPVRKDLATATRASDWGGENLRPAGRWKFGMPPVNSANYAWIQHFVHHLSPVGMAVFVMAKTTRGAQSCSMRITEDLRNYAAEQGIAEKESFKKGMEEKSREFTEKGSELYARG